MNRFYAVLQIVLALLLLAFALATFINLLFIAFRPETIWVVNVFIGQGLMIACLGALGRILLKKGRARIKDQDAGRSSLSEQQQSDS